MSNVLEVHRQFVATPEGDMHYRHAGEGPPLFLLHWSPSNSRQYEPILPLFAEWGWHAIALDTWGYGQSAKPPTGTEPGLDQYARVLGHVLDGLGIESACFAGGHTGASIAVEFAVQQPERVRALVLDGCPLYSAEEREEKLRNYAPPIVVQPDGSHLIWAWNHMANMGANVNRKTPEQTHAATLDLLAAGESYHLGYNAAFRYDLSETLPKLRCPVMCLASEGDPLEPMNKAAAALIPNAKEQIFAPRGTPPAERWKQFAERTDKFLKPYATAQKKLKDSYLA